MASPYIGEIRIFAGNFAPRNWALCNGQLLSISQNTALFAILGTTYGGNGQTTFALPNLQNRVPMSAGSGPGLTPRSLGEQGGESSVTLAGNQVGAHSHLWNCGAGTKGNNSTVTSQSNADLSPGTNAYATAADNTAMNPGMLQTPPAQPHDNMQPYQGVSYIICLAGVFPPRN